MPTYRVRGLPDGTMAGQDFDFIIGENDPLRLRIPGDQRGPDVCIPDSPAQDSWLDSRPDLVARVWDCEWRFADIEAQERFVDMLASLHRR